MKFLTAYKKGQKSLVKIVLDNGEEKWATTSDAVVSFAKKNFEEGEEVDVDYTEENGQYTVKRIMKKGKGKTSKDTKTEHFCEDCGATLKDGKYTKCYNCFKKKGDTPVGGAGKKTTTSVPKDELIKREAVAHATSRVMIGLQGQYDVNSCTEVFTAIYNHILGLINQ